MANNYRKLVIVFISMLHYDAIHHSLFEIAVHYGSIIAAPTPVITLACEIVFMTSCIYDDRELSARYGFLVEI